MPDVPDLAALQEKARAYYFTALPDFLAVLALVDTLQGENERLREALIDLTCQAQKEIMLADGYPGDLIGSVDRALSVLSVPPAKKKQP